MRIGIYQSYWGSIGGGGLVVGAAAEALSKEHDVEILYHRPDFSQKAIEEALNLDLARVRFRLVPVSSRPSREGWNPLRRLREERDWCAEYSRPYDLFINHCEIVPVFCHAPRGVLITAFPFVDRDGFHARRTPEWQQRPGAARALLRLYHGVEWRQRYRTYQLVLANSQFTQNWLRRRWGVRSAVVYPPKRGDFRVRDKEPLILSVGRFQASVTGHHKKHAVMIETFQRLWAEGLRGWRYVLAGGLNEVPEDRAYFESVAKLASGYPITLRSNATGAELQELYEKAAIFWHATGYGEDAAVTPDRMEHFGIATVEAMAAGCVPVVYRGGGQPEIVEDGRQGLLWDQTGELAAYTRRLIEDRPWREELSRAARTRSEAFSRASFLRQFNAALSPLLQ
jgi:glycosyltransferase involved in cell wall biosynthesis